MRCPAGDGGARAGPSGETRSRGPVAATVAGGAASTASQGQRPNFVELEMRFTRSRPMRAVQGLGFRCGNFGAALCVEGVRPRPATRCPVDRPDGGGDRWRRRPSEDVPRASRRLAPRCHSGLVPFRRRAVEPIGKDRHESVNRCATSPSSSATRRRDDHHSEPARASPTGERSNCQTVLKTPMRL